MLEQATNLTQDLSVTIKQVVADLGFRVKAVDADNPGVQIIHRGRYKRPEQTGTGPVEAAPGGGAGHWALEVRSSA